MIATLLLRGRKLQSGNGPDLTPSMYWPQPVLLEHAHDERGPVLIIIDHRIAETDRLEFLSTVHWLGTARKRNGTYRWGVFEEAAESGQGVETFRAGLWLEYLRELKSVTHADLELVPDVKRLHQGEGHGSVASLTERRDGETEDQATRSGA